ncbi:MAG: hypothetical protein RLZZ621_262 [Gemmatimonadota bacterium]
MTTASRVGADAQRAVQIIDRAMLDRLPGTSVQAAIAWAVGADLQSRSPAQADFALRGGTYEQTLILVDGQRMRDLQTGHFALDLTVPWDAIERIEIVRGPGAAQYGADAVGGVVNIITRTQARTARLRSGAFGTVDAGLSAAGRWQGTTAALHTDGQRSDGHRAGTDYRMWQVRSTITHVLGSTANSTSRRHRVRADVGIGVRDFGAATFYAPFDSYERARTATGNVLYEAQPLGRVATTLRAGVRRHSDDFILVRNDPSRYRNQHTSLQSEFEATARVMPRPDLILALGAEALGASLQSARLGDRWQRRGAVFGEVRYAGSRFGVHGGTRLDASNDFGAQWVPSIGASVRVTSAVHLRALGAGGWRQPTWTDRYYVDPANQGTPSLIPERFENRELGLAVTHADWRLDIAAFQREGTNTIDWVRTRSGPSRIWVATNIGRTDTKGIEWISSTPTLAGVRWTMRGTVLRARLERADAVEGKYALRPLTQSAGVTAQLFEGRRVWALIDVSHAKRVAEAPYTTVAARLGTRWHRVDGSLELHNLGQARAIDASGVPIAGRAVMVGLSWRYG